MLIKKELLKIKPAKRWLRNCTEAVAHVHRVKKCGNIFALDIYEEDDSISKRIFCDRKNYIVYDCEDERWTKGTADLIWWSVNESDKSKEVTSKYFRCYVSSSVSEIRYLAQDLRIEANERRYKNIEKIISSFPKFPEEAVKNWVCDKVTGRYIFVSKKVNGVRTCACSKCSGQFQTDKSVKSGDSFKCPICGGIGTIKYASRSSGIIDKANICTVQNSGGKAYIRWARLVIKTGVLSDMIPFTRMQKIEYYWTIKEGEKTTSYKYVDCSGNLKKTEWYGPCQYVYIYPKGINRAFDIPAEKKLESKLYEKPLKYDVVRLCDLIKNIPQGEVLLSLGLTRLLPEVERLDNTDCSFSGMLGISKQYIELYKKYNPVYNTHSIIRGHFANRLISEELFKRINEMVISSYEISEISKSSGASAEKVINYIYKQSVKSKIADYNVVQQYNDYVSMCSELKIELKKKYEKLPLDLVTEHDRLSKRLTEAREKAKAKKRKKQIKKILKTLPLEFHDSKYTVKIPTTEEEFIREGQELCICVGNGVYSRRHFEGEHLIIFIRAAKEPGKPLVVAEVDNSDLHTIQIHGYKNEAGGGKLPAGAKAFLDKYVKEIAKFRKKIEEKKGAKIA